MGWLLNQTSRLTGLICNGGWYGTVILFGDIVGNVLFTFGFGMCLCLGLCLPLCLLLLLFQFLFLLQFPSLFLLLQGKEANNLEWIGDKARRDERRT